MRKAAILSFLLTLVSVPAIAESDSLTPTRVVMISLDGLRPDYLLEATDLGLSLPNLTALMEEGVLAEGVVGVLPTVTYPSHVTLFTGVPPSVHGIGSNHVLDPEDRGQDPWYWFAADIRVPTLIHAAEAKGLVTGSVSWPATVGLPADYLMPEFWRGWSRHPFDRRFIDYFSSPGLMEAAGRFRNRPIPGFSEMTDRDRTDVAKWIIATAEPDLLLVHLFDLDFAQHDHGPGSPEALRALERNDSMIGELLDELRKAGVLESTVIFVVSDHGFFPTDTVIAPNTLLVEAGLIRLDDEGRVTSWDAYFVCDGGSAALALRNPDASEVLEKVAAIVTAKAREKGSGISRVLRSSETGPLGSVAPLVIDASSGYDTNRRVTGPWSSTTRKKGTHGHAPDRIDAYASLIISGNRVRSRGSIGLVPMTRIAPTVASLMGLTLDPEASEPIPLEVEAGQPQ